LAEKKGMSIRMPEHIKLISNANVGFLKKKEKTGKW